MENKILKKEISNYLKESFYEIVVQRFKDFSSKYSLYYKKVFKKSLNVNDIPYYRELERFQYSDISLDKALKSNDIFTLISILDKINRCYLHIKKDFDMNIDISLNKVYNISERLDENLEKIKFLKLKLEEIKDTY